MTTVKGVMLGLAALTLALTAAPAAAEPEWRDGFWGGHREEREWREERAEHERRELARREHERWEHERWERRHLGVLYPAPYAVPYCSTQDGYWGWNGGQYVWVPPQTVCR